MAGPPYTINKRVSSQAVFAYLSTLPETWYMHILRHSALPWGTPVGKCIRAVELWGTIASLQPSSSSFPANDQGPTIRIAMRKAPHSERQ